MFGRKNLKIKYKKDIEPQEIFLDALSQKQERAEITGKRIELPIANKTLYRFFAFFFIVMTIFFAQVFYLQVIKKQEFFAMAENNKFIIYSINAQRGVIYDKNMNQLVYNSPAFDLVCHKNRLPKDDEQRQEILKEVARIIHKDISVLEQEIDNKNTSLSIILENIPHNELILLEANINDFQGFEIKNNTVRDYKQGELFSHIIGYKRKTGQLSGLEEFYNQELEQKKGEILFKKDARGNLISRENITLPESGNNLVLYLDSELQEKVASELEKGMKRVGSKAGVAIALDVNTGGVLSLVSLPSYDNNLFSKSITAEQWQNLNNDADYPLINRVISGTYPMGSTIKPLMALAALEENIISANKKIHCKGRLRIKNKYWPDSEIEFWDYNDWSTHGWTDMRKAIAESCNVFFYTIGGGVKGFTGLGVEKIKQYLSIFNWGEKTGIDIFGEKKGFLPDPEWKQKYFSDSFKKIWTQGDTYHLSIGQGDVLATPIQIATSYLAIANGGKLLQPQIVQKVVKSSSYNNSENSFDIIKEFDAKIIRENFIDAKNLEIVRQGMRQAVTGENAPQASAVLLNSLPVKVAVKTGTAQTGRSRKGKELTHRWIGAFAPYENPEIVLLVMMENVEEGQVAVKPVAKEILEWYYTR
ncbi:MAG: penicillin-binding protein 2 [Patescibacteria group bacterium]|nr:penicillin-binding protein 2 [Patescibacteria group bacterium]